MQLHTARVQAHLRLTTKEEGCWPGACACASTPARDTHRNMHIAYLYVHVSVTLGWDGFLLLVDEHKLTGGRGVHRVR